MTSPSAIELDEN